MISIAQKPIHGWYPTFDRDGNFVELYGWDVILRQIFTVLVTRPGSRQWQPEFGCKLLDLLFENANSESTYSDVIRGAFKWLPHIRLEQVSSKLDRMSSTTGYKLLITLTVSYDGETKTVTFIIPPQLDLMNGKIHEIKIIR